MMKVMGLAINGVLDSEICNLFVGIRSCMHFPLCLVWVNKEVRSKIAIMHADYARYQQIRGMPAHTDSTLQLMQALVQR